MPNRKALIRNLLALTPAQFEPIITILDEKKAFQAGNTAEHSVRVARFVEWAEAPGGCGLEAIEEELSDQGLLKVETTSKPAGFSTVRRETERFFGRTDKLEELEQFFQFDGKLKITAAYGLPGVGKTQFALRYANDHGKLYQSTFFFNADTSDTLNPNFSDLARRLDLPIAKIKGIPLSDIIQAVVGWLETNDGWLAIFDNADNLAILDDYLPKRGAGHVLLTTRETQAQLFAHSILLEIFTEDEGTRFLLEKTGQKDETSARALAHEVGGLPLALDQAVAYVIATPCSLKSYLESYRKGGGKLRATHNRLASDHASVTVTFSMAFKPIVESHPSTADILRVCAFCAPDDIPEELFRNAGNTFGKDIARVLESDLDWDNALREATRFSLLRRNPETSMLEIHRVVQDAIKDGMSEREQRKWAQRFVSALDKIFPYVEFQSWPACARLIGQALTVVTMVHRYRIENTSSANLLNQTATFLFEHAQYSISKTFFTLAIVLFRKLGPDQPDTAYVINNLAECYRLQEQFTEALPLYEEAKRIYENNFGSGHPTVGAVLNNQGLLFIQMKRFQEAESVLIESLRIKESFFAPDDLQIAKTFGNLAGIYELTDRKEKASEFYEKSLQIRLKHLGWENPETARAFHCLGTFHLSQKNFSQAEYLLFTALKIFQQVFQTAHPDQGLTMNNLAGLYHLQKRYSEAELLYEQALFIFCSVLGTKHQYARKCSECLAHLRHEMSSNRTELL